MKFTNLLQAVESTGVDAATKSIIVTPALFLVRFV